MIHAFALAAAVARPARAEGDFLDNLHKAETRKSPSERVEYLDRAIKAFGPDDDLQLLAHASLLRGEAHYWNDEGALAEPDLSKAIELDPRSVEAYLLRGRILLARGDLKGAARDLREHSALKADDVSSWTELADAQLKAGDLNAALDSLLRADQLDPADWRVPLGRAGVAMARKLWTEAVDDLDAADDAAKRREPDVPAQRAICRVALGQPEKALADYDAAVPGYERALDKLGSKTHKIDAAAAREKAARAYFGRGRVNEFLTRIPEAVADYHDACRLGRRTACDKERSLASVAPAAAKPVRRPVETRVEPKEETPKTERRRKARVDSDAGDRIYAN